MMQSPELPERTVLLLTEPMRRGTGRRESLTSLFKRVCADNDVSVARVQARLIKPFFQARNRDPESYKRMQAARLYLGNQGGDVSVAVAEGLEVLTGAGDLLDLTLHAWNQGRVHAPTILVDSEHKWCAACYRDAIYNGEPVFDQLVWAIRGVEVCPHHIVELERTCRACGGGPFSAVSGKEIVGFCPRCYVWLGGDGSPIDRDHDEAARYLVWVAASCAHLLEALSATPRKFKEEFPFIVRDLADLHFDGRLVEIARAIGRGKSLVCNWSKGQCLPRWGALCEFSYAFQMPIADLLAGNRLATTMSVIRKIPLMQLRKSGSRRKPTAHTEKDIVRYLQEVEDGKHPAITSLKKAATCLGLDIRSLRGLVPEPAKRLVSVLAERRSAARQIRRDASEAALYAALPSVLDDLKQNGGTLSRRSLEKQFASTGFQVPWHLSPRLLVRARAIAHGGSTKNQAAEGKRSGNSGS